MNKLSARATLNAYLETWLEQSLWESHIRFAADELYLQRSCTSMPAGIQVMFSAFEVHARVQKHSPVLVDLFAGLTIGDDVEVYRFRLVKESAQGLPSKRGQWGINPASMRRERGQ